MGKVVVPISPGGKKDSRRDNAVLSLRPALPG